MNKKYIIEIDDNNVYLNGEVCYFACKMDKTDHDTDLNKKALVALANEMGHEPIFLFEEMAHRLDEMLNEPDDPEELKKYNLAKLVEEIKNENMG